MRLLRILYAVAVIASLGAAFFFYWQYRLVDDALLRHREFTRLSDREFSAISAKLIQTESELKQSLEKIEELNRSIAALEKEKTGFSDEVKALKEERELLQAKLTRLNSEKAVLEQDLLAFQERLSSLEELRKAIKAAKIARGKERMQERLARIEMLKKMDEIALEQGNRGYVLRDGESTFGPRARVRVKLEPVK